MRGQHGLTLRSHSYENNDGAPTVPRRSHSERLFYVGHPDCADCSRDSVNAGKSRPRRYNNAKHCCPLRRCCTTVVSSFLPFFGQLLFALLFFFLEMTAPPTGNPRTRRCIGVGIDVRFDRFLFVCFSQERHWESYWTVDAIWEVLYLVVLVSVCFLLRPSMNSQRCGEFLGEWALLLFTADAVVAVVNFWRQQ